MCTFNMYLWAFFFIDILRLTFIGCEITDFIIFTLWKIQIKIRSHCLAFTLQVSLDL